MDPLESTPHAARIGRLLSTEPVVWLSTVRPEGGPHLVPIWFSWDGSDILVASKPGAQKVRNIRSNPTVMLALGQPEDDFDVGLLEGRAELLVDPAATVLPKTHLAKYRTQLAGIGLDAGGFFATYSQVIRIRPTRFLPWRGRTVGLESTGVAGVVGAAPAPARVGWPQRIADRIAAGLRLRRADPVLAARAAS